MPIRTGPRLSDMPRMLTAGQDHLDRREGSGGTVAGFHRVEDQRGGHRGFDTAEEFGFG